MERPRQTSQAVPTELLSLRSNFPQARYIAGNVGSEPNGIGNQCFSTGRIITNAKRPVIAQKVHSGVSPNVD